MFEAQKRATQAWKDRRNLKRVELLVPADTLAGVDGAATDRGISRGKFIISAIGQALGTEPQSEDGDRLSRIETKLDALLSASKSKSDPPAEYITDNILVDIKPETQGPDERLVAIVKDYRSKGMTWAEAAARFFDVSACLVSL